MDLLMVLLGMTCYPGSRLGGKYNVVVHLLDCMQIGRGSILFLYILMVMNDLEHVEADFCDISFQAKFEFFCLLKALPNVPEWLLEEGKAEVVPPTPYVIFNVMLLVLKFEGTILYQRQQQHFRKFSSARIGNVPRYVMWCGAVLYQNEQTQWRMVTGAISLWSGNPEFSNPYIMIFGEEIFWHPFKDDEQEDKQNMSDGLD